MIVDLRSDTMTRPTPGMRHAMANAEVGDDCFGEDPTVNRLEEAMATIVGKEAGLLVTSGTQGNQLGVRAQTHHGDDVVAEMSCHLFNAEAGALAALSGVQARLLEGHYGVLTPEQIESVVRPKDVHYGRTALIAVENTHNKSAGAPWPLPALEAIRDFAGERNIRVHMDGARLFNAVVATGISAQQYGACVDTVSVCLSKGLGAPVGSVLVGDQETIDRARYFRKMFGGGMRQAGVLAAAGLYALEHHVSRMAEDHANARRLAEALASIEGVSIDVNDIRTNMLFFSPPPACVASTVVSFLDEQGVKMLAMQSNLIRAVTHLDISESQLDYAIDICRSVMTPAA